ncbi:MAG: FG-GAP-like repeat-containing protein, partial [bacterium]
MKKILLLFVVSILTLILSGFMFIERHKKGNLFKSFLIDDVVTVDANRILNYSSNDGQFATFKNPMNVPATEWPKGTGQTINFASGIWIAGQVSDTIRTAVALFKSEFLPGKVLNWDPANPTIPGVPDDPNLDKYRFYKIRKTDLFNPSGNPDYIEWPFEDGAPVNELGKPLLLGDQTLWTIFNDFNSSPHDSLLGTQSLGIEIQNLIWAYNRSDAIGDMIFIKFLFINKSGNTMDSTYIALWSDFDIGSYIDDLAGCDTTLGLGYMWNDGPDSVYGVASPAIGFDLLQGPIVPSPGDTAIAFGRKIPNFNNLNMTAFTKNFRGDPPILNDPSSSEEAYNYMKGFDKFGQPIIDPTTRQPSPFAHPGDPETGTGWIDSVGADKRIIVVSGPLTIAPGDSQEIVAAMLIAQGSSPANSVTRLKSIDILAQGAFDNNFPFPSLVLNNNSIIFDTVFITNQIDSVVTLTNIGNGDLTIKSTNITGTNAQDFTIESGGGQATLGRFASLKITIRFSTLSEGSKSAFLVITSNAESSPDTVSLSGTGVAAKDTLFTRITTGNIVNDGASSFSSSWGDYDADGDLDLFIANTNSENNFLYRNNGDGTFTKITEGDIVNDGGSSLGSSWGDYDNDGDLDLFVVNAAGENNSLYQNNGDGTFTKITDGDIVNDGGNSQACSWGDYDNDGYLDLFVANGTLENNFLYNNDGSGTFTKITQGIIVNDGGESRGCNWADFDNDGDLDLF